MDGFLLKTFKRLRKDVPRRFKDLKTLCDDLIVKFSEEEADNVEPEVYLKGLILSCETRNTRLMEIALDAFHYLLEHGQVGEAFKSESEEYKDRTPIGLVIETVCKCADEFDENVQVQVIKALLTAITSLNCEVHGANLLLSVRACFHINLMSKNPVIKVTAKAALTQMIDVIFQRMEINDQRGTIKPPLDKRDSSEEIVEGGSDAVKQEVTETTNNTLIESQVLDHNITTPAAGDESNKVEKDQSNETNNEAKESVLEAAELTTAKTAGEGSNPATDESFLSVYQRDAYLLFRALCKLSMKGMSEDGQTAISDSVMLQNKILSLELILNLLQNCGTAFRNGEKFIYAVRSYLCVSLLSNCTSQVAQVTGLSLQIFLSLLAHFKQHLKSEVEVFVSRIFIGILESENSTFDHKIKVLEVFHYLAKDPAAQTEIFVNYDCDLEATNLFSRMVAAFAKIAKNPTGSNSARIAVDFMAGSTNRKTAAEDLMLRTKGLEGLVFVLKSLMTSANLHSTSSIGGGDEKDVSSNGRNHNDLVLEGSSSGRHLTSLKEEDETPTTTSDNATNNTNLVEAYDKKQKLQEEIETGILRFNLSPMKGIKYLVAQGHLTLEAKAVANFLHVYQDKLDKTAVGDLLGREKEYEAGFCYAVLNEYVESMDFSDLAFDNAIRYFLSGFRLPGEAQKIDRIMEKFAERYYIQHKDEFASADMAFILAFSTIMLQTNLHNPAVKEDKRMTKEQFIKQNKGISTDGELSDSLLSDIYDRIAAEPISINEDHKKVPKKEESTSFVVFQSVTERKKKDAFNHERKEMLRASEAMIRQSKRKNSTFVINPLAASGSSQSRNEEMYVKPMFEIVWPPVIGVISQLLETSDDPTIIDQSILALHYSLVLSCRLDVSTARNTFMHALCKFTALDTIREMKIKNIACIRLLLSIALSEGEYLDENWNQALQAISLLARLLLFATGGGHTDDLFFSDTASLASVSSDSTSRQPSRRMTRFMSGSVSHSGGSGAGAGMGSVSTNASHYNHHNSTTLGDPITKLFIGPSKAEVNRQVEEANAELISRVIDPVTIDRIFLRSTSLSASSVLHFVRSLCDVSLLEITAGSAMNSLRGKDSGLESNSPRIFSLQKLVEVADYNMSSRSRVEWANIWKLLANHFSLVGTNDNPALAMFAIDSLKQLSIKFLQKDELSNFNFQRLFLKPFELIVANSQNDDIKDLVLRCLDIMIRACANNIRSGWRSIFGIFEVVAIQPHLEVSKLAFDIIQRLMTTQFELLIYDFVELMNCLVVYVSGPHSSLSLQSLRYLEKCAEHLATGAVLPAANAQHAASDVMDLSWESSRASEARSQVGEDSSIFRLWWPLLLGLSTRVADHRLSVRVEALATLRRILLAHGHIFSPQTWSVIFKGVLFPIIDSAKSDDDLFIEQSNQQFKEEWIDSTAASVFSLYSELFIKYLENDAVVPIFHELLQVFASCVCQDNLSLATMAVKTLKDLLLSIGSVVSEGVKAFQRNHIDLITRMLKNTAMKTLLFDYSQLGKIQLTTAMTRQMSPYSNRQVLDLLESLGGPSSPRSAINQGHHYHSSHQHPPSLLSKQRSQRQESSNEVILTPYGSGRLLEVMPGVPSLGLKSRAKVLLDWGGDLYTTSSTLTNPNISNSGNNSNKTTLVTEPESDPSNGREEKVSIPQLLMTMGTMSVVTNDLIKLVGQIWNSFFASFELEHSESLLLALEISHWHAFLFNEHHSLRMNLLRLQQQPRHQHLLQQHHQRVVTDLLPQEVLSLECMIHMVYSLYFLSPSAMTTPPVRRLSKGSPETTNSNNSNNSKASHREVVVEYSIAKHTKRESETFSKQYLERVTCLVFQRYLDGEQLAVSSHPVLQQQTSNKRQSQEEEDEEDEGFHNHNTSGGEVDLNSRRHEAYLSPMIMLLSNIEKFPADKFIENQSWLIHWLSKLVLCQNLKIRSLVASIYLKHVNPKFSK